MFLLEDGLTSFLKNEDVSASLWIVTNQISMALKPCQMSTQSKIAKPKIHADSCIPRHIHADFPKPKIALAGVTSI